MAGEKDRPADDAVLLGAVTALRREALARLTWSNVQAFAIIKNAAKKSRGRRRFATMLRVPGLEITPDRLRTGPRA